MLVFAGKLQDLSLAQREKVLAYLISKLHVLQSSGDDAAILGAACPTTPTQQHLHFVPEAGGPAAPVATLPTTQLPNATAAASSKALGAAAQPTSAAAAAKASAGAANAAVGSDTSGHPQRASAATQTADFGSEVAEELLSRVLSNVRPWGATKEAAAWATGGAAAVAAALAPPKHPHGHHGHAASRSKSRRAGAPVGDRGSNSNAASRGRAAGASPGGSVPSGLGSRGTSLGPDAAAGRLSPLNSNVKVSAGRGRSVPQGPRLLKDSRAGSDAHPGALASHFRAAQSPSALSPSGSAAPSPTPQ